MVEKNFIDSVIHCAVSSNAGVFDISLSGLNCSTGDIKACI